MTEPESVAIPVDDLPAVIDAEATYRTVPAYICDMALVLADTEDHEDITIRAIRKIVVQGLAALDRLLKIHAGAEAMVDIILDEPEIAAQTPAGPAAVITPREIRDWCRREGITVNAKGKIPTAIVDQYLDANA